MGTDHKYLEPIAARAFEDRTGRRSRIAEFAKKFSFDLKWYPRAQMAAPHALSKTPAFRKVQAEDRVEQLAGALEERTRNTTLDVGLEEVNGGPRLGQRPHLQSVRNVTKYTAKEIMREPEWKVEDIVGHEGSGRRRKYHVVWASGETTLEPRKNLADVIDGHEVVGEQLLKYWERNPTLSRRC